MVIHGIHQNRTIPMIDQRFALREFAKLEHGSPAARALHEALESEIANALHQSVQPALRAIADRLRELGHQLVSTAPEYDPEFHSWGYEHRDPDDNGALRIWVHTQLGVVSDYLEEPDPAQETSKVASANHPISAEERANESAVRSYAQTFKDFVQRYLGRPWKAADGLPKTDVEQAQARLVIKLPAGLRSFYLTLGALPELCSIHNVILPPKDLRFQEDYLVFMDENQEVVSWGMRREDLPAANPIIWQRNNTSEEWYSEEKPLAELLASMFDFYQTLDVWSPAPTSAQPTPKRVRRARSRKP